MAEKFLIALSDNYNMVSSWTDELYCSILKDGTISLRARKDGGEFRWWLNSIRGIKTPKQFIDAYESIDEIDTDGWSLDDDIFPNLFKRLPLFAVTTAKYHEIEYDLGDEELDFFLFSFPLFLNADVNLPDEYAKAYKVFSIIYNFTEKYFHRNGHLPGGQHEIMGTMVTFPIRMPKYHRELNIFKRKQSVKKHIEKCEWIRITRKKLEDSANDRRIELIREFVNSYLEENNKLPIGEFSIDNSKVIFGE